MILSVWRFAETEIIRCVAVSSQSNSIVPAETSFIS